MPSNKPWLEGPSSEDHVRAQAWQGAMVLIIGLLVIAVTGLGFGFVWIWTLALPVLGFFWLLVGLIRLYTGLE